ncbi:MAG: hypothetical protein AB8G22_05225 [Saprospiraceae bacterium]
MYKTQQITNILAFIFMIVMNTLANALPLGGKDTGELSDLYPNLFVPTGLTFSIWGLIYLWLIGFIIYQAQGLFSSTKPAPPMHERLGYLFVANGIFNGAWIFVWHYQIVFLSLLVMLGILGTLILIIIKLDVGRRAVSTGEKWLVHAPFTIYLGWISIATIANVTTVLVNSGYDGTPFGEVNWTIIMLAVGTILTILVLFSRNLVLFGLVVIWAYVGIILKQNGIHPPIVTAAGIGIGIITIVSILRLRKWLNV